MYPRIALAAAAILGVLTTSTGCDGGTPPGPAASTVTPTPAHPQVTQAEAEKHLAAYIDLNNRANARFDDRLLAQYETGASLFIDKSQYRGSRLAKRDPSDYKPFGFQDVSYFPVRSSAYPRVFLAKGRRQVLDRTTPPEGWKYHLFRQDAADGPWMQFTAPGGDQKDADPQPEIATDPEGLATEVPADASGLLIPPNELAAHYAAKVQGKPLPAPKVQFVGLDSWSSFQAEQRKTMTRYATLTERAAPASEYPTYALRTKDGGALVFTTVSYQSRLVPFRDSWVTDTSGLGFLKQNKRYTEFMERNYLLNVLAQVPPAGGSSKIRIIGNYSGMTGGRGA